MMDGPRAELERVAGDTQPHHALAAFTVLSCTAPSPCSRAECCCLDRLPVLYASRQGARQACPSLFPPACKFLYLFHHVIIADSCTSQFIGPQHRASFLPPGCEPGHDGTPSPRSPTEGQPRRLRRPRLDLRSSRVSFPQMARCCCCQLQLRPRRRPSSRSRFR